MPLPDIAPLEAVEPKALARLHARFSSIGLIGENLETIARRTAGVHSRLRRPLLSYHSRRVKEPWAYAARAFAFGDPITSEELALVFGDLTSLVRDAGLVVEEEGGFVSPYRLSVFEKLYILGDELQWAGDAVMGPSNVTCSICFASLPTRRVGTALDLGCGAGTIGLALAAMADRVVATDIVPRAVSLARINAHLNSIKNMEVREGSLFEPVKGETFDVVVSQPPFIPHPQGAATSVFMGSGSRGDELTTAILAALPAHLTPRGRGSVFAEWGLGDKTDHPVKRIMAAVDDAPVSTLVFQFPPASCDVHAVEYAATRNPNLDASFTAEATARLENCAQLGYDVMIPLLTVLTRADGRPPRLDIFRAAPMSQIRLNAHRIEKLAVARDVAANSKSLLAAKLRMVDGVVLREEQHGPGANVDSTLLAVLPPEAMTAPIKLTPQTLRLATCVHEASTARAGIREYRSQYQSEEPQEELAIAVGQALLNGLLEVADEAAKKGGE